MIATLSKSVCHRRKLKVRGTTNDNVTDVTLLNKVNRLHDIPKCLDKSVYLHLIYVKAEWQIHSSFSWSDIYLVYYWRISLSYFKLWTVWFYHETDYFLKLRTMLTKEIEGNMRKTWLCHALECKKGKDVTFKFINN